MKGLCNAVVSGMFSVSIDIFSPQPEYILKKKKKKLSSNWGCWHLHSCPHMEWVFSSHGVRKIHLSLHEWLFSSYGAGVCPHMEQVFFPHMEWVFVHTWSWCLSSHWVGVCPYMEQDFSAHGAGVSQSIFSLLHMLGIFPHMFSCYSTNSTVTITSISNL